MFEGFQYEGIRLVSLPNTQSRGWEWWVAMGGWRRQSPRITLALEFNDRMVTLQSKPPQLLFQKLSKVTA